MVLESSLSIRFKRCCRERIWSLMSFWIHCGACRSRVFSAVSMLINCRLRVTRAESSRVFSSLILRTSGRTAPATDGQPAWTLMESPSLPWLPSRSEWVVLIKNCLPDWRFPIRHGAPARVPDGGNRQHRESFWKCRYQ